MNELIDANQSLAERVNRPAQEIVDEATEKATLLKQIVQRTQTSKMIGEKEHLQIEAWQTIGSFYGCTARSSVEPINVEGVSGFKAHGIVTKDATGQVMSEADAYCFADEENWTEKDYFAMASMAQTRAMSKALANKFKWVVVLAGYATTPVEEMGGKTVAYQFKFPFGDHKGKVPEDLTIEQLCEEQARFQQLMDDPTNKFRDHNRKGLEAIKAALDKRHPIHAAPLGEARTLDLGHPSAKGDANLYEWALAQLHGLRPNQKAQAIGIMNTHKDHPRLSLDQRAALIDAFNEKFTSKEPKNSIGE